jgi:hypothetical protein
MPKIVIAEILKQFEKPTSYGAGVAEDRESELRIRAELEKRWAAETKAEKKSRSKGHVSDKASSASGSGGRDSPIGEGGEFVQEPFESKANGDCIEMGEF